MSHISAQYRAPLLMSQLELATQTLTLHRYPQEHENENLQAWDSADEYLLKQLLESNEIAQPLIIFNDSFGALACGLQGFNPISVSDSYISQLATRQNLKENGLDIDSVELLSSLDALPEAPKTVVIKVPRTLALLEQQLYALRQVVTAETVIIAAGKVKDIHTSTLQIFENIIGETKTSLAWKKARLIHCELNADKVVKAPKETLVWALDNSDIQIHNHANVFSRTGLDIGARFFMEHLPQGLRGEVIDLGCGNGVIGLIALKDNTDARVTFVDESYMAVESSALNVEVNRPQDVCRSEFVVNDGLTGMTGGAYDAILCNPPFHQQNAVSDHVAWKMFVDAKRCLKVGGELRIVGNRHLDYFSKLKRLFGNCTTISTNKKFVVLRAVKTGASK